MNDAATLIVVLAGLFVLVHIINNVSESLYWKFIDWKNHKKGENDDSG